MGRSCHDQDRYWTMRRRATQSGMGAAPLLAVCFNCGLTTKTGDLYNDWCVSCVLKWGHPDDAAEIVRDAKGWSTEAAKSFLLDATKSATPVAPIMLAVQSFGVLDLSTDRKHGTGKVLVERGDRVASDGFWMDDRSTGRLSREARQIMFKATMKLFRAGFPNRAIARVTGMSPVTVSVWRDGTGQAFACRCGDVATHQGWCWARFQGSRKRQEFIQRWHPSRVVECVPVDGFTTAWGGNLGEAGVNG